MSSINALRKGVKLREEALCRTGGHPLCTAPSKHPVPDADPLGPREAAKVLYVLRDPGKNGAQGSSIVSPFAKKPNGDWVNGGIRERDDSSSKQRNAFAETDYIVDPSVCLWWNAVPWVLTAGKDRRPERDELQRGIADLHALIECLPNLRVVVPMGEHAWDACAGIDDGKKFAVYPGRHKHPTRASVADRTRAMRWVASQLRSYGSDT